MNKQREYGKALGRLEEFRRQHRDQPQVRIVHLRHFWREAQVSSRIKDMVNKHDELVLKAATLRASLRAHRRYTEDTELRYCGNCKYKMARVTSYPCNCCKRSGLEDNRPTVGDNWEKDNK